MGKPTRIGIVGATGYVGMELVRLLQGHPDFTLSRLISQSFAGKSFSQVYPGFAGLVDQTLRPLSVDDLSSSCDLVITALPHGVSAKTVPDLLQRGLKVLDHSGDFRYRDASIYEAAYRLKHPAPQLLQDAVYGLPEVYRQKIASSQLVANPGCYPTCTLLGLMPLLKAGLIDPQSLIVDAYSGLSGAGRKESLPFSFCEADASLNAYGVIGHRHTSEIEQETALWANLETPPSIAFTPHLAPIKRGMLATIYARPLAHVKEPDIATAYHDAYDAEPFVRLLPPGQQPQTRHVSGTNFCDLAYAVDAANGLIKIFSAIDNLGKGAAAQAVQSLNCMTGLPETSGLLRAGSSI